MSEPRSVIVTAAGGGIGEGIARELAGRGWRLVLMSRSSAVERLAAELGGTAVRGSVAVESDLERLVMAAIEEHGRIDAVVNHTGKPAKGELLDIGDDDWHAGLDLLLLNVVRMARLCVPQMLHQGAGGFVNISSYTALEPDLAFPASGPLRAALGGFCKLFVDRYGPDGLRMNNVLPGFVDNIPQPAERLARIPVRRQATVTEVARTVAFLVCGDSAYVNGQSLRVDGGLGRHI